MKAMILAAGRGERLRPLTDKTPKPLLTVGGRPIIEYTVEALSTSGFKNIVINVAHLGEQIQTTLGDGQRFDVNIRYSDEGSLGLETGGGIFRALPLLGDQPFLVVNGDIFCEFPYRSLKDKQVHLAHLVMVPNPIHNSGGDFSLSANGKLSKSGVLNHTFSGIGVYRAELFAGCSEGGFRLAPVLQDAMRKELVSGELFTGFWTDVGTQERLNCLNQKFEST